ncbi:MAG TPA: type II secretion system protein [Planctomycetota bacterium]|nr:type II secretion system protein [Planctomycetota bacterium]
MRSKRLAGFTLLELLVVIAIVAVLMAAFLVIWAKVTSDAKRKATISRVMLLTAALDKYRSEFEAYPPNPASGFEDDGTLVKYLCGAENRGVVADAGTAREKHFGAFLPLSADSVKQVGDKSVLIDSWGTPLHYFNCKAYVDGGGSPENCHKPDKCDVWSYGPDKMKDPNLIEPGSQKVEEPARVWLVDDVTNWGSRPK